MADNNVSTDPEQSPTGPDAYSTDSSPGTSAPSNDPPVRRPRKVYEPKLLPERRHRHVSPWIVLPSLLISLIAIFAAIIYFQHRQRFVPTAGLIVYASDKGSPGKSHLWIATPDLINPHRITSTSASESSPAFAPTGSQIAFLSDRVRDEYQVFQMDADGRNVRQITDTTGAKAQPSYCPTDGAQLAFLTGGAVYSTDVETQASERLLPPAVNPNDHNAQNTDTGTSPILSYAWAPSHDRTHQAIAGIEATTTLTPTGPADGQAAMVLPSLDGQITVCALPSKPPVPVFADSCSLGWSPDGQLLALGLVGPLGATDTRLPGLLIATSQGIVIRDIADSPQPTDGPQNPVFSPDETRVVFELWQQPSLALRRQVGLFVSPVDGSAPPSALIRGPASNAKFTPDGQTLLFLGLRRDGGHDLFRADADGTNVQRLSDGTEDISGFDLSPQKSGSQ